MTSAHRQADRLGTCNAVGILIVVFVSVAAVIVCVDALHRADTDSDQVAQLVRVFGFARLSLVPSGRELRGPDLPNAAVDRRYDPLLDGIQPDLADLILETPD